jgi:hypothetical protein
VYQGTGLLRASIQLRFRTLARCAYSNNSAYAAANDGFQVQGRSVARWERAGTSATACTRYTR